MKVVSEKRMKTSANKWFRIKEGEVTYYNRWFSRSDNLVFARCQRTRDLRKERIWPVLKLIRVGRFGKFSVYLCFTRQFYFGYEDRTNFCWLIARTSNLLTLISWLLRHKCGWFGIKEHWKTFGSWLIGFFLASFLVCVKVRAGCDSIHHFVVISSLLLCIVINLPTRELKLNFFFEFYGRCPDLHLMTEHRIAPKPRS